MAWNRNNLRGNTGGSFTVSIKQGGRNVASVSVTGETTVSEALEQMQSDLDRYCPDLFNIVTASGALVPETAGDSPISEFGNLTIAAKPQAG